MDLDLIGVLEDGGPRGGNVPTNPRHALTFIFGADVTLNLDVVHADGEPLELAGWEFFWTIRKKRKNGFVPFTRQGTPVPYKRAGGVEFFLAAAETEGFKPGEYVYDIWAEVPGGVREPLVPFSALTVEPACYPADPGAITPNPGTSPGPAQGARVWNETPSGAKPGTTFGTASAFIPGREHVFLNGLLQAQGAGMDYVRVESGGAGTGFDSLVFAYPILAIETVTVDYDPA